MKHSAIAASAIAAAGLAANHLIDGEAGDFAEEDALHDLYAYARQRSFPPPETLARKIGELIKKPFPFTSIDEAPEAARVYFTTFRAVAQALEPFHEPDPQQEPEPEEQQPMQPADATTTAAGADVTARTADGQKAMDDAIAESGGKFSEPVPPAATEDPATPEAAEKPETRKKKELNQHGR